MLEWQSAKTEYTMLGYCVKLFGNHFFFKTMEWDYILFISDCLW